MTGYAQRPIFRPPPAFRPPFFCLFFSPGLPPPLTYAGQRPQLLNCFPSRGNLANHPPPALSEFQNQKYICLVLV